MGHLANRFRVWRAVMGRSRLRAISVVGVMLGLYDTIVAQLLPDEGFPVIADFIPGFPLWGWGTMIMAIVLMAVLEGSYRVVSPTLPTSERRRVKGWLDRRIEGEQAILRMSPQLVNITTEISRIGDTFLEYAPRIVAMQDDPRGARRVINGVARDMNRSSKRLERRLPRFCNGERRAALLFLDLVERVDEGEVAKLAPPVRTMCSEGLVTMLVGTTKLVSSVDEWTTSGPTERFIEASVRMKECLLQLLAGTAMLFECGCAFADAAERHEVNSA